MSRTNSEHETLLDEIAEVYASEGGRPNLIFIYIDKNGKAGMRICGFTSPGDKWRQIAALEWAKFEILVDSGENKLS